MYRIFSSLIFIRSWRNESWQRAGALDSLLAMIRQWVTPILCAYICFYMSYVWKAWDYDDCTFDICIKCFLEHEYIYDMLLEAIWCYCMIMRCKSMITENEEMICIWKMMKMQSMLKWWCTACYTVKESMKREWIDALSIGI